MAQAHSLDLRKRIVNAVEKGSSACAAVKRFDAGPMAAISWMKRRREACRLEPRKRGHGKQPVLDRHDAFPLDPVTAKADMTLEGRHGGAGHGRWPGLGGGVFLLHLKRFPVPSLRPGGIVIMDNLNARKIKGAREAIEAAGAKLRFLHPCSPGFNLVENIFAKLKALLRKRRRNWMNPSRACSRPLPQAADCANCFAAAGCANRN